MARSVHVAAPGQIAGRARHGRIACIAGHSPRASARRIRRTIKAISGTGRLAGCRRRNAFLGHLGVDCVAFVHQFALNFSNFAGEFNDLFVGRAWFSQLAVQLILLGGQSLEQAVNFAGGIAKYLFGLFHLFWSQLWGLWKIAPLLEVAAPVMRSMGIGG